MIDNTTKTQTSNTTPHTEASNETVVKKRSSQASVCEDLQELTKKIINKVRAQEGFSTIIQDIKIKKAKVELETAEIALDIVKNELALKKIEMDSKIRQMKLQEEILDIQKQKLLNN